MLEARITKAIILQDEKTQGTVLFAVAEYYGDAVNIKVPYEWETLDKEWFVEELKEKLAKDFDLPTYRVDIQEDRLLKKMEDHARWIAN